MSPRPRLARFLGLPAALALALLAAWPARAQAPQPAPTPPPVPASGNTELARQLYDAGAAAYGAGQYGAAVQAFSQAYAADARVSILFSLAQAERHLYTEKQDVGALRDAVAHYRLYLQRVPQGGRRVDATDALGALEPELARLGAAAPLAGGEVKKAATRLMVWTAIKDAVIAIDGSEHTESPVVEEVKPGPHAVKTRAPGYVPDERTITSVEGSLVSTEIQLREQPASIHVDAPPGTEVTVDGRPLGEAPLADVEVTAGAHLVGLSRSGHAAVLKSLTLERGQATRLDGDLPTTTQRKLSVAMFLGAGAAVLAGGAFLGTSFAFDADAKNKYDAAQSHGFASASDLSAYQSSLSNRDTWKDASIVTFSAAAGIALVGGLLYFIDHPRPEASSVRVGMTPNGVAIRF